MAFRTFDILFYDLHSLETRSLLINSMCGKLTGIAVTLLINNNIVEITDRYLGLVSQFVLRKWTIRKYVGICKLTGRIS